MQKKKPQRLSIESHHTEWLSLIEVSGPFLSIPVLKRAFPQGLEAHDPEHLKELRLAYAEWEEDKYSPAVHRAWVEYVLRETLGFSDEVLREGQSLPPGLEVRVAQHDEVLRPEFALVTPKGVPNEGKARLLVQICAPGQELEEPLAGYRWKASPSTRMMELIHGIEAVDLGLVTNGEQWMLVYAPSGETTG